MIRPPPRSTLFPYTPLFRSAGKRDANVIEGATVSMLIPPSEADFVFPALSAQVPFAVWPSTHEPFLSLSSALAGTDSPSAQSHFTVTSELFQPSLFAAGKRDANVIEGATVSMPITPRQTDFVRPASSAVLPSAVWPAPSELFVSLT